MTLKAAARTQSPARRFRITFAKRARRGVSFTARINYKLGRTMITSSLPSLFSRPFFSPFLYLSFFFLLPHKQSRVLFTARTYGDARFFAGDTFRFIIRARMRARYDLNWVSDIKLNHRRPLVTDMPRDKSSYARKLKLFTTIRLQAVLTVSVCDEF